MYVEHLTDAAFLHEPHEAEPYEIAMNQLDIDAFKTDQTIIELDKAKHRLPLA